MSSVGHGQIPQQHPQQHPDSAGGICECVSVKCGCIRTKRNETKQNDIVEECHSYVQFVSWQSHHLGMATRSPPS